MKTRDVIANLQSRKIILFNKDWLFKKGNYAGAKTETFDDSQWRKLNVPHDWSVEESFDPDMEHGGSQAYLPRWDVAWYRKRFFVDSTDEGKMLYVQFDGIHNNSEVWINGHFVGKRPYGYVSFQYDITPYIRWNEENVLAVKVDNTVLPPDRWYSGSGIYRNVWLVCVDPLHVSAWGTFVTTPEISTESASVNVKTTLMNQYEDRKYCRVVTEIFDDNGVSKGTADAIVTVPDRENLTLSQDIYVSSPNLWSPDNPVMYCALTSVYCDERKIDDHITHFGIREVRLDKDTGLYLNGVNLKLKGVCLHHDLGCLGAAYHDREMERRLKILKEMGCNAIRLAHNPMSAELLDLCDQMGFLVIAEAFDKWKSRYYGELFDEWWERDLEAMLLRDRNHPSIFLWSVGNEVEDQGQPSMLEILDMLVKYCHEQDPTRPVTCALEPHNWPLTLRHGSIEDKVQHTKNIAAKVDILGLNYQEQWYEAYRNAMPDTLIVGTETFPYFRGNGSLVKAYEPMNPWFDVANNDYVIGQFVWAGIDYLGESSYPSKGWSSGLIDTCGFRKPISYLQQSLWSDKPIVQIAVFDDTMKPSHNPRWTMHWKSPKLVSHWTFPHFEEEIIRLVTFTNCESVELFVNDECIGEKHLSDFPNHMMEWYLPYIPGEIRAVGKNRGVIVSSHEMVTTANPYALSLQIDRTSIADDGHDIAHVEVTITDENGVVVPSAEHDITFELEGEGSIIGVDNGDLTSDEPYRGNKRKAYMGRCLVIVQSKGHGGVIRLTASSDGLKEDTVIIESDNSLDVK